MDTKSEVGQSKDKGKGKAHEEFEQEVDASTSSRDNVVRDSTGHQALVPGSVGAL